MKKVPGLEQTYLTIQKRKNAFKVTGYDSNNDCSVILKAEEMEAIKDLALYGAEFFPGTTLQKVLVTMRVGDPWEQWWSFLPEFGNKLTVKVRCEDFKTVWEGMHT